MRPKLTRSETIAKNKLDKAITEIHARRCSGWSINVMDISKVFNAGYAAAAIGGDVEAAVVEAAKHHCADCFTLRHDCPRHRVVPDIGVSF
jgi:hypothetical protein